MTKVDIDKAWAREEDPAMSKFLQKAIWQDIYDKKHHALDMLVTKYPDREMVNSLNERLHRPLHVAVDKNDARMVGILLKSNVIDVNALTPSTTWSETPLHMAAHRGNKDIVKILLADKRIDTTITDEEGLTASERAENSGHKDIAAMIDKAAASSASAGEVIAQASAKIENRHGSHTFTTSRSSRRISRF